MSAPRCLLAAVLVAASPGLATKPSGPVRVTFENSPQLKTGEETTTEVTFNSSIDVAELTVVFASFKGMLVLSTPAVATLKNLKAGEPQRLSVKVRLIDTKWGSLAVTWTSRTAKNCGGAITIEYRSSE